MLLVHEVQICDRIWESLFMDDPDGKIEALDIIMRHYIGPRSSSQSFSYPEEALASTAVIKVEIESMSGKRSDY